MNCRESCCMMKNMIEFKPLEMKNREYYQSLCRQGLTKGCGFTFNSIYMWGEQCMAFRHGCALIRADYNGHELYPYPVGDGDRKAAVEDLILDAEERGIPLRLCGLDGQDKEELENFFPGRFEFREYRDGADYIYEINALADLPGSRMHKKKNHVNRFLKTYPDWRMEEMTAENLLPAQGFLQEWYAEREAADPEGDYEMEKTAFRRAFAHFEEMEMEGLYLLIGNEIAAFTMGSFLNRNTFDVHFEKAKAGVDGAYAMINREFARYLREKHPELCYIDREDDMGLSGLRQAKLSYRPLCLIGSYTASLRSEDD